MGGQSTFMLLSRGKKPMGSTQQRPKEPTLKALASEMSRLRERVEDLEDLRDLLTAERAAGERPGIPWDQAKKLLELDDAPGVAQSRVNKKRQ
jgi:hypothetical protein